MRCREILIRKGCAGCNASAVSGYDVMCPIATTHPGCHNRNPLASQPSGACGDSASARRRRLGSSSARARRCRRMRRAGGGAMRRAAARCDVRRGSCGPRADAPPRVLVSTRRKCEPALLAILKRDGAPRGGCLADTIPLQREQQPDAHAGGRALCATDGPHQRQQGRASSSTHAEAHDLRGATPPARLHAPQH